MKVEELENQRNQLIEELGILMEREHQLSPVAGRILSTLILNGQEGSTFDRLVHDLNASKSTVSTHLDQLQSTNKIKYFTKPGDRKRYFIVNPNLPVDIIDEMISHWETEKAVHQKILEYKKKRNELLRDQNDSSFNLNFQQDFLVFLEEATTAIKKLKSKLNQKHLTKHNS